MQENGTVESIEQNLRDGVVHFTFEKADGTTREAIGTTNGKLVPDSQKESKDEAFGIVRQLAKGDIKLSEAMEKSTELMEYIESKEGTGRQKKEGVVVYYDLQQASFRSFVFDRLKEVKSVWAVSK